MSHWRPLEEGRPLLAPSPDSSHASSQDLTRHETTLEVWQSPPRGTVITGTLTLINTMIGSGMIALPFAFAQPGIIAGSVYLILSAAMAAHSAHLVALSCDLNQEAHKLGKDSFYAVARRVAPQWPRFASIVDGVIAVQCFGCLVAYMIVIGQSVSDIVKEMVPCSSLVWWQSPSFGMIIVALVAVWPLSQMRTLSALKQASSLALFCISYIAVLVMAYGLAFVIYVGKNYSWTTGLDWTAPLTPLPVDPVTLLIPPRPPSLWRSDVRATIRAIPIFLFAFTCHTNVFVVANEMSAPRTVKRVTTASINATLFATFIYAAVGLGGVMTLGAAVSSNVLVSYAESNSLIHHILKQWDPTLSSLILARLALLLLVITCFPMQAHPCREALISLLRTSRLWLTREDGMEGVSPRSTLRRAPQTQLDSDDEEEEILPHPQDSDNAEDVLAALRPSSHGTVVSLTHTNVISSWLDSNTFRHHLLTAILVWFSVLVASSAGDAFGTVLMFIGATSANAIGNLMPAFFYCALQEKWTVQRIIALIHGCLATFLMVAVLINMMTP